LGRILFKRVGKAKYKMNLSLVNLITTLKKRRREDKGKLVARGMKINKNYFYLQMKTTTKITESKTL